MENAEIQELLNKNLIIVRKLENKAQMFGKGMFVLSLLDVIFGLLAIFCTSLQLTALFASATSLTAITICGRVIQISKVRQIEKSLKTLDLISIAWFVNKYQKYFKRRNKKMTKTKSTVLQKILSTVLAIFGVGGLVVSFFPEFTSISAEISKIVSCVSEGIAICSGIWLATTNDAIKSDEEIASEEQKLAEKEAEQIKKDALKELEKEKKQEQLSQEEKAKAEEKEKAEAEYRAKVEAMKTALKNQETSKNN